MNFINECPVCLHKEFGPYLTITDHMISKESFDVVMCQSCGFHFTNPIPIEEQIGEYYKSQDYISHSSSKKGLINWLYNAVRKRTLKQKVSWVKSLSTGSRLLDVGSGTGHFLCAAIHNGFNAKGLEPDREARGFAKDENGVDLLDLTELYRFPPGAFDAITMWHVLEHVYHLRKDLGKMSELLDHDGRFFIAVPNMNSYDARVYESFWAAYDVPRHLYHFQQDDLIRLFGQYNFELEVVLPMKYDAYYVSMLSEKYRGGSILRAVVNGWRSNREAKNYGYSSQVYVFSRKKL
jgi:2-polyprenyl-3-methyl-5-hydroxy-6-metoxy-1,4-benzoquinol methylase